MACVQEASVARTQIDSDSKLVDIEKPGDEEEELPEGSEPVLKRAGEEIYEKAQNHGSKG